MRIHRIQDGKEYLFVCGQSNLFSKYEVDTAKAVDSIKILIGNVEFIGLAYSKKLNCLITGSDSGEIRLVCANDFN